jgi:hypothetical protein
MFVFVLRICQSNQIESSIWLVRVPSLRWEGGSGHEGMNGSLFDPSEAFACLRVLAEADDTSLDGLSGLWA